MRSARELCRLAQRTGLLARNEWQIGTSRAYAATTSSDEPSSSGSNADVPVYAACVLQRLPLIRAPTPSSHAQYLLMSRQRELEAGGLKVYPEVSVAGKEDAGGAKQQQHDLRAFNPVPSTTAADAAGDVRTMRRQLMESLYLVVRRGGGAGGSSSSGGDGGWSFPSAPNTSEESISDTAQRALFSSIGRTHPVFFVGNAPMAHLQAQPKGTTFFMLAQAVDDPWDLRPLEQSTGLEYAWLTKSELVQGGYLGDARLRQLVGKML